MAYNQNSGSFDFKKVSQEAYSEIVEALSKDMPLIMHGCGDVDPRNVNPESALVLAQLTANYISNLVEAACDSQEILNDGHRPPLPPPPLVSKEKRRRPPLPSPYEWPPSAIAKPSKVAASKKKKKATKADGTPATTTTDATNASSKDTGAAKKPPGTTKPNPASNKPNFGEKKKRKRRDIDYWDDPLPEPKIKNKPALDPAAVAAEKGEIVFKGVPIGDWVGVAGVDFFEDSRIRSAHVTLPAAVGAQNFIFPVCHDKHLYGKILDIQATRRSIEPILTDSVVMDMIRAEADLQGSLGSFRKRRGRQEKRKNDGSGGADAQDDEDEEPEASDSEDEYSSRRRPVWPGLDELLPMHTTLDF
ncbi:unnamed protein product [Pseudo-nitzschia multistriata]|uniref:Uncharacterized protein n=1 Tax=Pseudo-nitzschia multistriata TaxID=183589 RepID=A0A448YUM4_9STRA|nr:unnamed protein product [Pseudo-nitzschia multistriata]